VQRAARALLHTSVVGVTMHIWLNILHSYVHMHGSARFIEQERLAIVCLRSIMVMDPRVTRQSATTLSVTDDALVLITCYGLFVTV
jgi:hypothetical protein